MRYRTTRRQSSHPPADSELLSDRVHCRCRSCPCPSPPSSRYCRVRWQLSPGTSGRISTLRCAVMLSRRVRQSANPCPIRSYACLPVCRRRRWHLHVKEHGGHCCCRLHALHVADVNEYEAGGECMVCNAAVCACSQVTCGWRVADSDLLHPCKGVSNSVVAIAGLASSGSQAGIPTGLTKARTWPLPSDSYHPQQHAYLLCHAAPCARHVLMPISRITAVAVHAAQPL